MALIECPNCGKEISDKAKDCIHCGYNLEEHYDEIISNNLFPIAICPECKIAITKKSSQCPNCGCPLDLSKPMVCKVNGQNYDLSYFYHEITENEYTIKFIGKIGRELADFIDVTNAVGLSNIIHETKEVPEEYNCDSLSEYKKRRQVNTVYCPNCGSTNVEEMVYAPLPYIRREYWYCNNCHFEFEKH